MLLILSIMFLQIVQVKGDCPDGKTFKGKCYIFYDIKETFAKALYICLRSKGYPIIIEDAEENQFAKSISNETFWLGIAAHGHSDRYTTYEGDSLLYNNLGQIQKNEYEVCAIFTPDKWKRESCTMRHKFVCKHTKWVPLYCGMYFDGLPLNKLCYTIEKNQMNYWDAKRYCDKQHMVLANISTPDIVTFVSAIVGNKPVWIYGKDEANAITKSKAYPLRTDFEDFKKDTLLYNAQCMLLYPQGNKWFDIKSGTIMNAACGSWYSFVCQYAKWFVSGHPKRPHLRPTNPPPKITTTMGPRPFYWRYDHPRGVLTLPSPTTLTTTIPTTIRRPKRKRSNMKNPWSPTDIL